MESFSKDLLQLSMMRERASQDAIQEEIILERFKTQIDWSGRENLRVPLYGTSQVAEIYKCMTGVDVLFLTLTQASSIDYRNAPPTPPEPADCNHCGAVLPLANATGECHRCAGQPDDVYPRNTVTVVS
jgi:hypothetical protein